jgi:homoaconitase/3-isopropylmalate dehydratase large subunit
MTEETLYDKLWNAHLVKENDDGSSLLYIDRHVLHGCDSRVDCPGVWIPI